ncbi:MAG TPA: UDP-N-acetyl-D-glucosamine dehydrogenase, partial [Bacillota bacterium]|nr:UDP-N-acetyl-D-glucosamine dehydrogenase [Bacillota bacterium]
MQAGSPMEELKRKIETRQANVVVVGLGYVGLPLAVEKGNVGFHVTGIEKCEERVKLVNEGKSYIPDVEEEELRKLVEQGRLIATSSYDCLDNADIM